MEFSINTIVMGCASAPSSKICGLSGFVVNSSEYGGLQSFLPDFERCFIAESSEVMLSHEGDVVFIDGFGLFVFEDLNSGGFFSANISKGGAQFN